MATTDSSHFALANSQSEARFPAAAELTIGFSAILLVLWLPTREQVIVGPIVLLTPLALVLWQKLSLRELGFGWRSFLASLWIFPAAIAVAIAGILLARAAGTLHDLYKPDVAHVGGYVLWTIYQQFLLQDYFMPRLTRLFSSDAAIGLAAVLFAVAHLPNVVLTIATLVWGAISCGLFRRYRNVLVLGMVQGLLGLCFAISVPDVFVHHMRVGLGYWQYQPPVAGHYAGFHGAVGK